MFNDYIPEGQEKKHETQMRTLVRGQYLDFVKDDQPVVKKEQVIDPADYYTCMNCQDQFPTKLELMLHMGKCFPKVTTEEVLEKIKPAVKKGKK